MLRGLELHNIKQLLNCANAKLRNCGFSNSAIPQFKIPQFFLLFVAEFVANTPHRQHHLRVLGVLFDLGSEAIDV